MFESFVKMMDNEEIRARMQEEFAKQQAARFPTSLAPKPEEFQLWETCMTINDTWASNPNDQNFKSAETLIKTMVEVVSRGGNFLLNVGPTPKGVIQEEFQERLLEIGEWLGENGESIYGTTYGPIQDLEFARTTAKGDRVFLHVLDWPSDGELSIPGVEGSVEGLSILESGTALEFEQDGGDLKIQIPEEPPNKYVTVLALDLSFRQ
jgi:alpha-L-fucosidase